MAYQKNFPLAQGQREVLGNYSVGLPNQQAAGSAIGSVQQVERPAGKPRTSRQSVAVGSWYTVWSSASSRVPATGRFRRTAAASAAGLG